MRISRAIDRFLEQMELENDWTARTIDSVYRVLAKLADENPEATLEEFSGAGGTEKLRAHLGRLYGRASASTRANRISYFHSFFGWAEDEGHIADDPSRRIKRPPKRKPDVYQPSQNEISALLAAATPFEMPALLLLSGAGLRASEVVRVTWRDLDLTRGHVRIRRKGRNWQWLPIDPLVIEHLRSLYTVAVPALDDHVFVAATEQWASSEHRVREVIDPKTARTEKTLWRMVRRVSDRAGIHPLGPHMLRRGFANGFLRATRDKFGTADVWTLQLLMGHSRIDTTEQYLRALETDEAHEVLRRLHAQASPDEATEGTLSDPLFVPVWMEAAGIEPASAPDGDQPGGVSEPEEPRERPDTSSEGCH